MNKIKLKTLENLVMNKAQSFMNEDLDLKVIRSPMDISCGFGCFEVILAKENEYHEQIEKIIITNLITSPNTTEIQILKVWDWRSGGYWNRSHHEVINNIKYI